MKQNFWSKLNRPILALAPMAGITDSAFRQICREYGADVVYSEMASVSALFFKPAKTLDLVRFNKKERPYIVQLFGNDPAHFAKAAQILNSLPLEKGDQEGFEKFCHSNQLSKSPLTPLFQRGKLLRPDGIDINFGCPAKKVFGHGSGCALMPQKKLAREIISAVCENTNLPVSLKIRAGIHPIKSPQSGDAKGVFNRVKDTTAIDFIENVKDLPFSAVMIHGRTYEGGFHGEVNFAIIEKIKKIIPDKIVLANGGINTPEDAINILQKYPSIDGLGIARGAWGRPFIFEEIKSLLKCHPERSGAKSKDLLNIKRYKLYTSRFLDPLRHSFSEASKLGMTDYSDFEKIKKIMLRHAKLIWQDKKELGMFEIRKHLAWYVKGFPGAAELRKKLVQAKSVKEIKNILK